MENKFTKCDALYVLTNIIKKRSNHYETLKALEELRIWLLNNEFDYNKFFNEINNKMSGKLGGYAIQLNKSLEYLKLEIKKRKKNIKKWNLTFFQLQIDGNERKLFFTRNNMGYNPGDIFFIKNNSDVQILTEFEHLNKEYLSKLVNNLEEGKEYKFIDIDFLLYNI
jgi:hypothetical protein